MIISLDGIKLSVGARKAFSYILHNQPVTRAQVCSFMGIGASSISKYISELIDRKLIDEYGVQKSTGGRKPLLYKVSTNNFFILCINISTIYCEVAISDFSLNLLKLEHFHISSKDNPDDIVNRIVQCYREFKKELNLSDFMFLGGGVTLFSELKDENGIMYEPIISSMNKEWLEYPFVKALRNKIRIPIYAEKGITATAALEYNFGSRKTDGSMLYILCATSIRSAFMLNGKVQQNSPYYEDAFGHMVIDFDGRQCQCGQYGCLNCYSTIPVILEDFKTNIKLGKKTSFCGDLDNISIEEVCALAENNDECASDVIRSAARYLGIALANYVNVTNPGMVVMAGLIVELSDLYYETAIAGAQTHLDKTHNCYTEFRRLGSFEHPITTSCASLVLESLFS